MNDDYCETRTEFHVLHGTVSVIQNFSTCRYTILGKSVGPKKPHLHQTPSHKIKSKQSCGTANYPPQTLNIFITR